MSFVIQRSILAGTQNVTARPWAFQKNSNKVLKVLSSMTYLVSIEAYRVSLHEEYFDA
jgi:hypothetical protein